MTGRKQTENEIKLTSPDCGSLSRTNDPGEAVTALVKLLDDLKIKHKKVSFTEQTDRYYDDDNGTLCKMRSGIRVREKRGSREITLKTPSSSARSSIGYARTETEYDLGDSDDVLGRMRSLLSDAGLGDVILSDEYIVEVRNLRHKIPFIADSKEYELCFDELRFYKDGNESETQYEVEIEAIDKKVEGAIIEELINELECHGFVKSGKNKYERGREWVVANSEIM
jgi:uncharacterized protein YjbK